MSEKKPSALKLALNLFFRTNKKDNDKQSANSSETQLASPKCVEGSKLSCLTRINDNFEPKLPPLNDKPPTKLTVNTRNFSISEISEYYSNSYQGKNIRHMSQSEESRRSDHTCLSARHITANSEFAPDRILYRVPSRQLGQRSGSKATFISREQDVRETQVINKDYDPTTGHKCINQYLLIKEIGRGAYGKVKLAMESDTKEEVAIKIVCKKSKKKLGAKKTLIDPQKEKIRKEIAILKKCIHPNIVRLREVIDNPASEKIYLVLEYLKGGEVKWRTESEPAEPILSVPVVRRVMRDIIAGVQYLHYQGIIHRDIKPANLLWTSEGRVKISDFGVSVFLGKGRDKICSKVQSASVNSNQGMGTSSQDFMIDLPSDDDEEIITGEIDMGKTAGSPAFFAPEMCDIGESPISQVRAGSEIQLSAFQTGMAIDIWAIGVTLFCLLFGRLPFSANSEFELFRIICNENLEFPKEYPVSDSLRNMLIRILDKNPQTRITLEEIKTHNWLTEDFKKDEKVKWLQETDPEYQEWRRLEVTDEDVQSAVNILTKIRSSIRKFSSSFFNFTHISSI